MKKALTIFTILFGAGYLLGVILNSINPRDWSETARVLLTIWFVLCTLYSLLAYEYQEDAR